MKNEFSLDTALATDLVMPLLAYAELLKQGGAYAELLKQGGAYAQSRLLLTLVEDLDRKLMGVFDQVNNQAPTVRVALPSLA